MRKLTTPPEDALVTAVREAVAMLDAESIEYRLVGTAALRLLGYDVPWGGDVDFLCPAGVAPEGAVKASYSLEEQALGAPEPSKTELPSGGKADFIDQDDEGRRAFWTPIGHCRYVALSPGAITVAALSDILGLKAWAGRPKDRVFFDNHVGAFDA